MSEQKAGIKLNTKTWHYKLIKFVLGSAAPTPQNMHNLCPYFWLLIFSMFATPFMLFFGGIAKIFMFIGKQLGNVAIWIVDNMLVEPIARGWFNGLEDMDILKLYDGSKYVSPSFHRAKIGKNDAGYDLGTSEIINRWFLKTYNRSIWEVDTPDSRSARNYSKKFIKWKDEQYTIKRRLEAERAESRAKRVASLDLSDFVTSVDRTVQKTKTSVQSWTNIIKWTKRVTGGAITAGGLTLVYFVINFIGRGFLWLVENFNGPVVLDRLIIVGIVIGGMALLAGIIYVLKLWVEYVAEQGLKLWYVKMLYYPLFWFIYTPLKFIMYDFVFNFVLINLIKGIIGGSKMAWYGILGFFGIFGEYFGASYSDYCPGIEWEENEEVKE